MKRGIGARLRTGTSQRCQEKRRTGGRPCTRPRASLRAHDDRQCPVRGPRVEEREEKTHQLRPTLACPSPTTHSATQTLPAHPPTLRRVAAHHAPSSETASGCARKKTQVPWRSRNESEA